MGVERPRAKPGTTGSVFQGTYNDGVVWGWLKAWGRVDKLNGGEVAEWLNAAVSKTVTSVIPASGVRIPPSPLIEHARFAGLSARLRSPTSGLSARIGPGFARPSLVSISAFSSARDSRGRVRRAGAADRAKPDKPPAGRRADKVPKAEPRRRADKRARRAMRADKLPTGGRLRADRLRAMACRLLEV